MEITGEILKVYSDDFDKKIATKNIEDEITEYRKYLREQLSIQDQVKDCGINDDWDDY